MSKRISLRYIGKQTHRLPADNPSSGKPTVKCWWDILVYYTICQLMIQFLENSCVSFQLEMSSWTKPNPFEAIASSWLWREMRDAHDSKFGCCVLS